MENKKLKKLTIKQIVWIISVIISLTVISSALALKLFSNDNYELSRLAYLNRSILLIEENYVEPERINPKEMFLSALKRIESYVPEVMVNETIPPSGSAVKELEIFVGDQSIKTTTDDITSLWKVSFKLGEVFRFIEKNLTRLSTEEKRNIEYASINGMLQTLDPHSVFMNEQMNEDMEMSTKGKFGGLGIVITLEDGELTVISPIPDTPAAKAGIKPWDKIITIGEESTISMGLEEAVSKLRGEPNTKVTIGIMRKGFSVPKQFTLTRAEIRIKSVKSKRLEDPETQKNAKKAKDAKDKKEAGAKGDVAYIQIKSFDDNTYPDLVKQFKQLKEAEGKPPLAGIILDLRDNPGGLLEASVKVSDFFLSEGTIVSTVGMGDRLEEERKAKKDDDETDLPVVVLVNSGSASASEIVAGALKNNNRGIILGERTFGKGSVQVLYRFDDIKWQDTKTNESTSLKLTIAQYLTPGGISIQTKGIMPDIEVRPATIAKDFIELEPAAHRSREKDLKKHFDAFTNQKPEEKPVDIAMPNEIEKIIYPYIIKDEDEKERRRKEAVDEEIEIDYPILLAQKIILAADNTDWRKSQKELKPLIGSEKTEENLALEKELSKRGINWKSAEVKTGKPKAELSFELIDPQQPVESGDKIKMKFAVKNVGDASFSKLRVVTKSENYVFDEREFIIGTLAPSETVSRELEIELPLVSFSRTDEIYFKFFEDNGNFPPPFSSKAFIKGKAAPTFAVKYEFDDPKPGGNGDKKFQPGETGKINVSVKNAGSGLSPMVIATLKNDLGSELFLKQGRLTLKELTSGEEKKGDFVFTLSKETEAKEIPITLSIFDTKFRQSESEKLSIPLNEIFAGSLLPPTISVPDDLSKEVLDQDSVVISGTVTDEEGVSSVYVMITNDDTTSGDKIFLKSFPTPQKEVKFETPIKLSEGANFISISARKGKEFGTHKILVLSRRLSKEKLTLRDE